MGNPGARFPYGKYEKDPSSIQISNLPAGMSTLKRPAHYGRSQLKMILEAEEHVVISVGEKRKSEASTTETTGDVVTQNPETESQVNPVENPTSNATNVDTNSTTQPGPSQLTSEIPQTKDDNFHARMQERSLRELSEAEILLQLEGVTKDLQLVCSGEIENWKHDILKKGASALYPDVKKIDLKLNSNLGPYTEDQLETAVKFVMKQFPKEKDEYRWYVLFPEALARITKNILNISMEEANNMMEHSVLGEEEIQKEMHERSAKRAKKGHTSSRQRGNVPNGMKQPNYKLEDNDETNILNPNYMLTDREIMIGQNLLHRRFPKMNGLMSTTLGPIDQFDVMRGDFVQILHNGSLHCVCVANVSRRSGCVNLFDSMFSGSIATSVKEQIAAMLYELDKDEIDVHVQPVQQQTNSTDCGVFALAFATAICLGYKVSHCHFDVEKMRSHLWKCMKEERMEMFPCKRIHPTEQPKVVRVNIYCNCRQIKLVSSTMSAYPE
jgi:hypothetical protein